MIQPGCCYLLLEEARYFHFQNPVLVVKNGHTSKPFFSFWEKTPLLLSFVFTDDLRSCEFCMRKQRERESTCFGIFMRNRHPQISQHSDDNVWQVKEKPGLPEGNKFLGVWSALYSLYHPISNHNRELPAVPSPQTSTHNCLWPELQPLINLKCNIHHSCLAAAKSFPPYSHKTLCQFPLSCPVCLHSFLFWNLHKVLLLPFPTTLLSGFCSSGHSQGNPLSVMFWSSPLQTAVSPNSPSLISFWSRHQNQPVGVPLVSWHYPVLWGIQPWGRMQKFTDYDLSVHFLSSLHWLLLASRPSLLHLGNDFTASSTSSLQIQWGFDLT